MYDQGCMPQERLQKIIAAAGIASRRKAEELITSGRVRVNGEIVTGLGSKANPQTDDIRVDGQRLRGPQPPIYLLLNKPRGYVTTVSDPQGRPTVMSLVQSVAERVYPVGRLDYASEGLLLLTNDGALAQKLTHASSHVPKTYLVKVSGRPSEEGLQKLRRGIMLPPLIASGEGKRRPSQIRRKAVKTAPARIELVRDAPNPWYEVTLIEGRTRQIRRMFEEIGHHVEKIKRVRYGPLVLDVEPGRFRKLTPAEVARLKAAGREQPRPRKKTA
jgi:23S rRNA pseudouridine2605 synthase